jgi:SpoVK/Ycf46/Vps4 family AAA+-type ATPase
MLQVHTEEAIDVEEVAQLTEGFSGADLQAIVSESQLSAVLAHLEKLQAAETATGVHNKHGEHTTPYVTSTVWFLAPACAWLLSGGWEVAWLIVPGGM